MHVLKMAANLNYSKFHLRIVPNEMNHIRVFFQIFSCKKSVTLFSTCLTIFGKLLLFIDGKKYESVDDLTLPIPMERLREMANRMNQILTNLLVSASLPVYLL